MEEIKHMEEQTPKGTELNIEGLYKLCPQCFTEAKDKDGKVRHAVDFDKLRELLGDITINHTDEHYEFNWVGKRDAFREASEPTTLTLRPCPEESKDWEHTKNLYIEGNNLDVLKLLLKSYAGKVKMIYIDPPYNTGKDFVYHDNFHHSKTEEAAASGDVDEQGYKYRVNTESNGEFHSDWCSMMYSRLLLARTLLTEDGVIFISIDDNEQQNLKDLCNELFGEQNFIAQLIWERAFSPKNDAKYISNSHDYILMFAKSIDNFVIGRLARTNEANARYSNPDDDPRGPWMSSDISVKTYTASCDYPITTPSGRVVEPPAGRCWSLSRNAFLERLQDNRIWFGPKGDGTPRIKRFLSELKFEGMAPTSILFYKEVGHSQEGAQEVVTLFGNKGVFDGPKPKRLLLRLLTLANLKEDSIILDFFSGSATTAHAVIQKNTEDGGHRKFIMVQLPEPTAEKSEAYKAGYKNICEIGKERIRRAGKKIKEDSPLTTQDLDTGFRVLKVDSSNMTDVFFHPNDVKQNQLDAFNTNIKDDRTPLDLLFDCMLRWGLTLDMPISTEKVKNCNLQIVNRGDLIGVFDGEVTDDVVHAIAKKNPLRVVFRDDCFTDSNVKLNVYETFKQECGWNDEEAKNNIRVI
jgi:adenine-specific DNA-methyltransferase